MSEDETKLEAKVNEYFEKYMCVPFDKFIENWEQTKELLNEERKINYMFASQCDTYRNQLQQKENIIKEVREYITSYESIETIQQFDHNKNNKDLDYSTIDEMTRRYMMVHDKTLEILDKEVN